MSKILIIRHLPESLSFKDKEQLLKHFGAERVWETRQKRHYVFASFPNIESARTSLTQLHQLEIAERRLVVEYSFDKESQCKENNKSNEEKSSLMTEHVKKFIKLLNAWNPSINFYQPPPCHISYKYPDVTANTAINIIYAMFSHKPLYVQILHLMNKMSLDAPFEDNEKALSFFKETFRNYFVDEITSLPAEKVQSEPESEISSDETECQQKTVLNVVKRKHTLPMTRKRPAAILFTAALPKAKKIANVDQKEVFEAATQIQEPKKISLVVTQDALHKQADTAVVIGELGKFQKEEQPIQEEVTSKEPELTIISKKELLKNRISYNDMKMLPVFKNYHAGQPSMRLYIKNLAKSVTEQDLMRIYKRYIENVTDEEETGFDIRLMQEGRMKGQAFVTFPSERIAEVALNETNGFLLREKPMVVQFARAANKRSIE